MNDWLVLAIGVVCAGAGGELFVRGTVGLARWARIAPGIIGATIAAFATSSPELAVSVSAALAGKPQIGLGDALGSNVVNIALVLGLAVLMAGLRMPRASLTRDFPSALLTPIVIGVLLVDGFLSRIDAGILLALFCSWLGLSLRDARRQRSAAQQVLGEPRAGRATLECAGGLALLVAAGGLIVAAATGIAARLGLDSFVVGATLVALGTSTPELATVLVSRLRGHDEVGLDTVLGSNIFNLLFIVPVAALMQPIRLDWPEVVSALLFGLLAVLCMHPGAGTQLSRRRGMWLLLLYAGYISSSLGA